MCWYAGFPFSEETAHVLQRRFLTSILGVSDRAARKFFTAAVLRPAGGAQYTAVSQKILSATACRYLILWLSRLLMGIYLDDDVYA